MIVKNSDIKISPDWEEHDQRQERWRPQRDNLDLLIEMNAVLASQSVPERLCRPFPKHLPMLLICGTPRSGTTLMLQLLANAFELTYPDNVSARLWGAPYFGIGSSESLRQQMGVKETLNYESISGIAEGTFGPHDFGYFWERFFPFGTNAYIPQEIVENFDDCRLKDELAAMYTVGGLRPLMFRGINFTANANFFSKIFNDALFIDLRRDRVDIALSMLKMRKERYGHEDIWWGVSPPERKQLEGLSPEQQVVRQVYHLRQHADKGLQALPRNRWISLEYKEICNQPNLALKKIKEAVEKLNFTLDVMEMNPLPNVFEFRTYSDIDQDRQRHLKDLFALLDDNDSDGKNE